MYLNNHTIENTFHGTRLIHTHTHKGKENRIGKENGQVPFREIHCIKKGLNIAHRNSKILIYWKMPSTSHGNRQSSRVQNEKKNQEKFLNYYRVWRNSCIFHGIVEFPRFSDKNLNYFYSEHRETFFL